MQVKWKVGFVDVEDAIVELDYTSQLHKDLTKRRKFLFCVALPSEVIFLFQAPSEHQRTTWYVSSSSLPVLHTL